MSVLMVSGEFLCARAGKITEACEDVSHIAVCRKLPPQFDDVYESVHALRSATQAQLCAKVASLPGDIIHVHNEPNWPVVKLREVDDRPIIMNVHDVTSARPTQYMDPWEVESFDVADAFVFVSAEQRQFAIDNVNPAIENKPYICLPTYGSHSTIVEKPVLPHLGGLCYVGGADPRGYEASWRDQSPVADLVPDFHIYPGNPGIDYGILHDTVLDYRLITQHIARHDWGYVGVPVANHAWAHSYPNKVYEYLLAGIPIIALNTPLLKPLCDAGYGIYLDDVKQLPVAMKENPKPYAKRVRQDRYRFTMRYNIQPLLDLYEQVAS